MRKWLRRLGIAVVLMAVASATALYSYGRFAEAARALAARTVKASRLSASSAIPLRPGCASSRGATARSRAVASAAVGS